MTIDKPIICGDVIEMNWVLIFGPGRRIKVNYNVPQGEGFMRLSGTRLQRQILHVPHELISTKAIHEAASAWFIELKAGNLLPRRSNL